MNLGDRVERLVVIEVGLIKYGHHRAVRVRCDCGKERIYPAFYLRTGNAKSCGCLGIEKATARVVARSTKHGMASRASKHPDYQCWSSMNKRCNNPADRFFACYGGRGIKVCDRWRDFALFVADMGIRPSPQHSIDRIDVNGNYEPANCRWATTKEQRANQRRGLKISDEQAVEIRRLYRDGGVSNREIAKRYDISIGYAKRLSSGRTRA